MTVAQSLEAARRAALRFLFLSAGSFGCYRNIVHGMHRDMRRTGKVQPWHAKEVQASMDRCANAAKHLEACYGEAWGLLVDANRPEHGKPLAFQRVRDMASAVMGNWGHLSDKTPADRMLDTLIDTGRYILCGDEEALSLWNAINHEFAIAGIKHGITTKPVPHPEAETRARVEAMLSPLLRDPKPSWQDPLDPPKAQPSAATSPEPITQNGGSRPGAPTSPTSAGAVADPASALGEEDLDLLMGWESILLAIGMEPVRKNIARMKRLNKKRKGPIYWVATRPHVTRQDLKRWLNGMKTSDRSDDSLEEVTDVDAELNNRHAMREAGYQVKIRPNNQGTLAKRFDPLP